MPAQILLIVGPPHSGKTARLRERYLTSLAEPGPGQCLWLTPSHGAATELRDAIAARLDRAVLDPGGATFAGFAETVVAKGPRRVRAISRLQKRFLLRQAIAETRRAGQLAYLESVAETPGFLAQLDEWIAELKRRDQWAEDFAREAVTERDRELAVVYRRYQRRLLDADLYDAEGRFWAAREILAHNSWREPLEYRLVVVAGFSDFTVAQFDILRLLAERAREMCFALTADAESLAPDDVESGRGLLFGRARETCHRLRELLPDLTIEHSLAPRQSGALSHLGRNLFREDAPTATCAESIEIVAASGDQSEIEEIARRIKADLHANRASPQDFLVVFPRLADSAERVAEVFDDFGIPHWIESRPRLARSPLVRTAVSLLRLELDDWPFRGLLEVVGSHVLRVFDQQANGDLRAGLEVLIRSAQLPSGKNRLLERLRREVSEPPSEEPAHGRGVFAGLSALEHLADALQRLSEQAFIPEWTADVERLLTELGIDLSAEFAADWQSLRHGLCALSVCDTADTEAVGLDHFVELVEMVADDQPLPGATDAVGCVRVLTAESARHTSAPHVYLAGLSEGSFSSAPRVDQLDTPNQSQSAGDAMHLFYSLATRATETLTLSYPALDDRGQELPPSPFVDELKRCFALDAIRETRLPLGDWVPEDAVPFSRSAHRQIAVGRALERDRVLLAGLTSQPNLAGQGILDAIAAIASRRRRDRFGPFEGLLESDAARTALARRFDSSHHWSPSQLESYAACAFRFLAENLLELKALDDLTLANDPGRRGSLLHQVLAAIHAQLLEQPADSPTDEAWQAELAVRFSRALDARIEATPLGGVEESLREIERRQIAAWADQYARQEAEYRQRWRHLDEPPRPAYFEVRFGPEVGAGESSAMPGDSNPLPFELDLGEEKIRITGQIDRIDVGRVGGVTVLNVIDYKSGKQVQLKDEHFQAGRQLQLPLYALAAEEHLFKDQGARALAAGYWSIQGQGFEKGHMTLRSAESASLGEPTLPVRSQVQATVRQLVAGVRTGQFPVYNVDPHCTRWCEFSTICRVAQIRSLEKEWPTSEEPAP